MTPLLDKSSLKPCRALRHRFLGLVWYSEGCKCLEDSNPDPSSLFVEHDGDTKEVSLSLITRVGALK